MGSLDRLLELEHRTLNHITSESNSFLKPDEEQEYQSLKSQIEKAVEYYTKTGVCEETLTFLKQNQKSPQDIINQEIVDMLKEWVSFYKRNNPDSWTASHIIEHFKSILEGEK